MQLWRMRLPNFSRLSNEQILEEWRKFVRNGNFQDEDKQRSNLRGFPDGKELLFPPWIMDRLKEAMDEYVRGHWWSSIALCGMIVEFVARSMAEAFREKISNKFSLMKVPGGVVENLLMLKDCGILDEEDFGKLDQVREYHDKYLHLRKIEKEEKEQEELKLDSFKALKRLLDFFDVNNMGRKYLGYLEYLYEHEKCSG